MADEETKSTAEDESEPNLDSLAFRAQTFVVGGKPMTFAELQAHNAETAARMQQIRDGLDEETEMRRLRRIEDVQNGIITPEPERPEEMAAAAERAARKKQVMDLL